MKQLETRRRSQNAEKGVIRAEKRGAATDDNTESDVGVRPGDAEQIPN